MKIKVEIPDRSITRAKLEYPTEGVSLTYLSAIGKVAPPNYKRGLYLTTDSFTDKSIRWNCISARNMVLARSVDASNDYEQFHDTAKTTGDHFIARIVGGTWTALASEAVDLSVNETYLFIFSISGSTLKGFRDDLATPKITVTDTNIASGRWGIGAFDVDTYATSGLASLLNIPATTLPPALAVLEVEVEGGGGEPYRPLLNKNLVEITSLTGLPSFLYQGAKKYEILKSKGFTEEEIRILLGDLSQHQVDLNSITWGAFEFSEKSPTNIIIITEDNPYMGGAIDRQKELARSKNLRVLDPPRTYGEAVAQYQQLKREYQYWLAGKDNYAYQVLGLEELDLFQNVDFYFGELVERKTHYQQLKQVPEWELWRRLEELERRLEKVKVLAEERDKHLGKLREVKRLGW
jgi:hypothetical protein